MEEPVRSEGFGVVLSGQMEVVQATLKPGSGRGRRGRGDGEEGGDEDEDDGDEGEGEEDGMIGLGGYGGSYMDDVEEEIALDGVVAPPALQPVEEFIPPPPSMHLRVHQQQQQQQQQQQMALNAAIHHGSPLEDMNLLLKNGNNGFAQTTNFAFQQPQEQLAYNPYQQPTFSSYVPDKLWNEQQYAPPQHTYGYHISALIRPGQ